MMNALGRILLWIVGIILGIILIICLGFYAVFGDAAIWIVRVVLIIIIAKYVWKFITK